MNADPVNHQIDRNSRGIRRILVVRLGALGDIVLTIPAQQLLSHLYPSAEIDWLTSPPYVSLLSSVPGIRQVWAVDTRQWKKGRHSRDGLFSRVSDLRRERFDLAIDFQGLLKSAVLSRLSGAGIVRGFSRVHAREGLAALFYTERVRIAETARHQFARHADLICPPVWTGPLTPRFPLLFQEEVTSYVELNISRQGVDRPLLLNPGGGWTTKRWAPDRFAELAERIEQRLGLQTLFTFGPGEEELEEAVRGSLKRIPMRSFPTSILQLAALCRNARLMVAGDTGPLHLAVAMGTPTVAVLGPAEPSRTGPADPGDEIVLHSRKCPHPYRRRCRDHFCMDISVDSVFDAVRRRLRL